MTGEKNLNGSAGAPQVGIVMGSDSDLEIMKEAASILKKFQISYEMTVASAHRTPQRAAEFAETALKRGLKVIIAGAGHAAHLAGVLAAHTVLPVIGVPIDSSCLQGLDALLATVQMPPGIPVATMAIGKSGARNAGILAVQIIATGDPELSTRLENFKQEMARQVEEKAKAVEASEF
jgi:phosphoribosylamine--glycine ligase